MAVREGGEYAEGSVHWTAQGPHQVQVRLQPIYQVTHPEPGQNDCSQRLLPVKELSEEARTIAACRHLWFDLIPDRDVRSLNGGFTCKSTSVLQCESTGPGGSLF